jgi:Xaa-Pro aminopeptidase
VSTPAATVVEERARRVRRVRARMDELGVDALLLSHGADLPWLTGYRAMPLERLTVLVLPRHGDAVLVVPALEAPRVPDTGGLFTLRPWAETEDPVALAAALLNAEGASGAAGAGATFCVSDRAWAHSLLALQAALPGARWRTASTVTSPLRAVKDESEIAALRAAAQAADRVAAFLQAGEIPLVGRTELQVSEEIGAGLLAAGHRRVNFAIVGSGPNGASPHHDAGDRVIGAGDTVVCDFGGEYALHDDVAYCSDITRTVVIGEPGAEVRDCYAVLRAAQQAAVEAVKPGVTAAHVDAVARGIIAEAGLGEHFIHRTGHGIGIEEHEDPYLVAGNDTVLAEGHAFSVEPGIYLPGRFGMRLEDIVVVGSDGVESLNTADHGLAVIG